MEVSDASTASVIRSGGAAADSIRPFRVNVPEEALENLHRRLAATQWPGKEPVSDRSQGVQLATMKELVTTTLRGACDGLNGMP
jgi:hypothetical protein